MEFSGSAPYNNEMKPDSDRIFRYAVVVAREENQRHCLYDDGYGNVRDFRFPVFSAAFSNAPTVSYSHVTMIFMFTSLQ
ncbi:MAG: hypothetical protein KJ607_03030 [Bacteroidetes bacterium]|nr:hypothetical protein [Bacteroidota bacterium]